MRCMGSVRGGVYDVGNVRGGRVYGVSRECEARSV